MDSDGQTTRRGEVGDLHLASQSVIKSYLGNEQSDSFYTENESDWFITGDRAMIDREGSIYIVGRSKDIIKRGGIPIAPAGLESCLQKYGGAEVRTITPRMVSI